MYLKVKRSNRPRSNGYRLASDEGAVYDTVLEINADDNQNHLLHGARILQWGSGISAQCPVSR